MIVYNLTMQVAAGIETDWLEWQRTENIPAIMATTLFSGYKCFHLLGQDEHEGVTYVFQYFATSQEYLNKYLDEFAPFFQQNAIIKWGEEVFVFATIMEQIQ